MTRRGIRSCLCASIGLLLVTVALALGCPAANDASDQAPPPAETAANGAGSDPGQPVPSAGSPRIVSLSPLATRFLGELGVGPRVVPLDGPTDRLEDLVRLDPDYVFLPTLPDDQSDLAELEASGARVVAFAPHNLEDVMTLLHGVGVELVGEDGATAFERRVLRPVALIAGQSSPLDRLRVLALVGVDPPEIAGGHSFETDLIEIAGASSLTHGGSDNRQPIDRQNLAKRTPDLVVVMTDGELAPADQDGICGLLLSRAPLYSATRNYFAANP